MPKFKITLPELTQMVDEFLASHQASMAEAEETGSTTKVIPATRATFVRFWQVNGNSIQRQITGGMVKYWMSDAENLNTKSYADQIARVDDAASSYFERLALINPKLTQLAQFGSKQECYGGYKDKPEHAVNINIANKGAKVNWGS